MMSTKSTYYDFTKIEAHWQKYWEEQKTFKALDADTRPKFYALDMFPYPSGDGLHIGHPEGYTASDILVRYKKACGYNVLHPMGWDAFGLPAEQHAVKTGTHPAINTQANIDNFRKQLKALGLAIDWEREVNTTDPGYYKWTQWIFLQLFKRGLAYVDEKPVWWCPALGTVLANEEVIDGRSERGDHPVERRNLRQWVLRITAYADRLLKGLEGLDWPDSTKRQQKAWIGRSEGSNVYFDIEDLASKQLICYTTRIDTLFGASYMVLAPEHPLVDRLTKEENKGFMDMYIQEAAAKSDLKRAELCKEKTGVFTGSYAINPVNGAKMPIWVSDYVIMTYGTGVVMAVPAHDERDFEFSKKFDLPIHPVLVKKKGDTEPEVPFFGKGYLINSGDYDGLSTDEAKKKITEDLHEKKHAEFSVHYKLRDWLFSRQRYWGEPFPVVWVDAEAYEKALELKDSAFREFIPDEPVSYVKDGVHYFALPLPSSKLPLKLPEVESYEPSGSGESPLAKVTDWLEVFVNLETGETRPAAEGQPDVNWIRGARETNTMPQWAGSCWYYLRYVDPKNADSIFDSEKAKYWGSPDIYIGGAEHAVLHLLYARFWHQVLFDLGIVPTPEPFSKVIHQGLILGEPEHHVYQTVDGDYVSAEFVEDCRDKRSGDKLKAIRLQESEVIKKGGDVFVLREKPEIQVDTKTYKMSKSRGNVVSPDDVIRDYGSDALRLYEMFLGPLEAMKPWNTNGIEGIVRFLRKIWREFINEEGGLNAKIQEIAERPETDKILQETIKKVTEDIEALRFNTAISQLMIFMNHFQKMEVVSKNTAKVFVQLLATMAPHLGEELWASLGEKESVSCAAWPKYDASKLVQDEVTLVLQVNGKLRDQILASKDISKEDALSTAKASEKLKPFLEGKSIVKEIYVPGKIVNLVVK